MLTMNVHKVTINNIKKFSGKNEFNFSDSKMLNTISGKNGAGKSTIFSALMLAQKAFFAEQLIDGHGEHNLYEEIGKELFLFFNDDSSFIEVSFSFSTQELSEDIAEEVAASEESNESFDSENNIATFKLYAKNIQNETVTWDLQFKDEHYEAIKSSWNLENPKNIIAFVESDKHIAEPDVTYSDIELKPAIKSVSPIVDLVLNHEDIFEMIYKQMFLDYTSERLIPVNRQGPVARRDINIIVSKILLKVLMPTLEIRNFSGTKREQQFILTAKNTESTGLYDIRYFSSGEKFIWYLVLFINRVRSLGTLIIDEPENHLHEELISKLAILLNEMAEKNNYVEFIIEKGLETGIVKENNKHNLIRDLEKEYNDFKLSRLFLITHSKNLIYSTFTIGKNYLIDQGLQEINYEECEKTLRQIGISYTNDKILFVEGETDVTLLEAALNKYNIKIHPLGNCTEVIETFNRISSVKKYLYDPLFVFLIDKDTRIDEDIEQIRNRNPLEFDNSFIVMNKHEMENYLLDENIIYEVLSNIQSINQAYTPPSTDEILRLMKDKADESLVQTKKKYINNRLWNEVSKLKKLVNERDIPIDSEQNFNTYIDNTFITGSRFNDKITSFRNIYQELDIHYSNDLWSENWKELCDGKQVINKTISILKHEAGVTDRVLKDNITYAVLTSNDTDFKSLISQILNRFEI